MLLNTLLQALRSIRRNLLRSFLTILGIVIGVSAVITMVTLGNGATLAVQNQISGLGTNLLQVRPGQRLGHGGGVAAPAFKEADADAIASQIGGIAAVAPEARAGATVVAGGRNWSSSIIGSTNAWLETGNWKLGNGRTFTDDELRAGAAVCLIGETVRRELYGARAAVGEQLRVKQISCAVVGVLASKGQGAFGNDQDDLVLMPIKTLQRRITGNTRVNTLLVSMMDG
ncbi:MAG: ABC transporter permease, partial [Polaromonas sp.]